MSEWVLLNDLNLYRDHCLNTGQEQPAELLGDAIDEIQRLRQANEQLRKDNQRFIEILNHLGIDPAEDGGPTGEWVPAMEIQKLQRDKAELVFMLSDRDGGSHDTDCPAYHDDSKECACLHDEAIALITRINKQGGE